jgi:hypothetical protein
MLASDRVLEFSSAGCISNLVQNRATCTAALLGASAPSSALSMRFHDWNMYLTFDTMDPNGANSSNGTQEYAEPLHGREDYGPQQAQVGYGTMLGQDPGGQSSFEFAGTDSR